MGEHKELPERMASMTSLRREAEALLKEWFNSTRAGNDEAYIGISEDEWKGLEASIEAFAKAQRRKEVEAIQQAYTEKAIRKMNPRTFVDWLSQRAKALEP